MVESKRLRNMAIKAIILVGGKATRLEPLAVSTPKALIPVLNIPFLEYVIRNIAGHRIEEMVLALGHLAKPIEDCFGDGSRLGVKLYYSIEDTPLGSAGAAKNAEKYLDDTFLVFNGDNFIDLDITAMIGLHRERKAKVTIALTLVDDPTSFGLVETTSGDRVTRFLEKPKPEEVTADTVNAGAWLVEPGVMAGVPSGTPYSYERNVFPDLLSRGEPVCAYTSSGYWMDTGTPEKYLQLQRDLLEGKSGQYAPAGKPVIGEHTDIHPASRIEGQVIIGTDCSIGEGVRITGPVAIGDGCIVLEDTVIEDSVIWKNARLGHRVYIKHSILADNCRMDGSSSAEDSVLGDNVTVLAGCKLVPGSKISPGETVK